MKKNIRLLNLSPEICFLKKKKSRITVVNCREVFFLNIYGVAPSPLLPTDSGCGHWFVPEDSFENRLFFSTSVPVTAKGTAVGQDKRAHFRICQGYDRS